MFREARCLKVKPSSSTLSLPPSLSCWPNGPRQTGPGSTSHARRLGGIANGRPGLLQATRIKGGHSDNPAVWLCQRELLSDLWTGHPNHQPIQTLCHTDALDIVITKNLSTTVYLTSCSSLSSDHLTLLINTTCQPSFPYTPDRSDFRRTDWTNFQTHLEDQIPFGSELHEMAIDACVENFSGAVLKALTASTPKCPLSVLRCKWYSKKFMTS